MRLPILIAALALAAAGCAVGPDYKRPEAVQAAAWKTPPEAAAAAWPAADWWAGFASPELSGYIDRAQRNNLDIAAAAARVAQADARTRIAGAALLPSVSAGADVARSRQGGGGLSSRANERTSYAASIAASYEVDFWGKNRSALNAAQSLALASRYDRETIAITVLANVATTYFVILEFRDRLAIAYENLANAESVLAIVEARVNNGAASALDLAQQRTVVANQRAALPALEQQLRQTENALAILLGVTPDALTIDSGSLRRYRAAGGGAGPAVGAAGPPPRHRQRRGAARRGERGYRRCARGAVPEHPAHGADRLREPCPVVAVQQRRLLLHAGRVDHPADLRGRPPRGARST